MLMILGSLISVVGTFLIVYFGEYGNNGRIFGWTIPLYLLGLFALTIACYILFLGLCSLTVSRKKKHLKPRKSISFLTYVACQFVIQFFRLKINIIGKENMPKNGSFLFVCNHQSIIDPMIILNAFPGRNLTFIMKEEVMKIPIVGRYLYGAGFLPLNRKNNRQGAETIINAVHHIEDGYPVCVFPEGTRSKDTYVAEIKNGVFKAAQRAKSSVVVATIDNVFMVKKRFPFKGTKIVLKIEEVIPYDDIKDIHTNEIGQRVKNTMDENIENFRKTYPWISKA